MVYDHGASLAPSCLSALRSAVRREATGFSRLTERTHFALNNLLRGRCLPHREACCEDSLRLQRPLCRLRPAYSVAWLLSEWDRVPVLPFRISSRVVEGRNLSRRSGNGADILHRRVLLTQWSGQSWRVVARTRPLAAIRIAGISRCSPLEQFLKAEKQFSSLRLIGKHAVNSACHNGRRPCLVTCCRGRRSRKPNIF